MSQVRETLRMAELDFSSKNSAISEWQNFPILPFWEFHDLLGTTNIDLLWFHEFFLKLVIFDRFFAKIRSLLIAMVLNGSNGDSAILESENHKIPHLKEVNTPLVTRGSASLRTLVTHGVLISLSWGILRFSDSQMTESLHYHKLLVTPNQEFEWQFGGKTVLAGLRLIKQ
jgi:hypothetical protein